MNTHVSIGNYITYKIKKKAPEPPIEEVLLPEGYIQLKYLKSDGVAYIDSGILPNINTGIKVRADLTIQNEVYLAGAGYGGKSIIVPYPYRKLEEGFKMAAALGTWELYNINDAFEPGVYESSINYKNDKIAAIGKHKVIMQNLDSLQIKHTIYLFCHHTSSNNPNYFFTGKVEHVSITQNQDIIFEGIPCINPDGEYGLYDTVSKEFFGTANKEGKFTGEIKNPNIYGITFKNEDTANLFSVQRVGNPDMHRELPIQNSFRGCIHNVGEVNYYLNADNWDLKEDGTPAVLDGTDGYIGVDTGTTFYGKVLSNNKDVSTMVLVSKEPVDNTWIEIPRIIMDFTGATVNKTKQPYKTACVYNTSTNFRGGETRWPNTTNDQYANDPYRTNLGKYGTNWSINNIFTWTKNNITNEDQACAPMPTFYYIWVIFWLYAIEYASFNNKLPFIEELTSDGYHQGGLGNSSKLDWDSWNAYNSLGSLYPINYLNSLGNHTGIKRLVIPAYTGTNGNSYPSKEFNIVKWRGVDLTAYVFNLATFGDVIAMGASGKTEILSHKGEKTLFRDYSDTDLANDFNITTQNNNYISDGRIHEKAEGNVRVVSVSTQTGKLKLLSQNNTQSAIGYIRGNTDIGFLKVFSRIIESSGFLLDQKWTNTDIFQVRCCYKYINK